MTKYKLNIVHEIRVRMISCKTLPYSARLVTSSMRRYFSRLKLVKMANKVMHKNGDLLKLEYSKHTVKFTKICRIPIWHSSRIVILFADQITTIIHRLDIYSSWSFNSLDNANHHNPKQHSDPLTNDIFIVFFNIFGMITIHIVSVNGSRHLIYLLMLHRRDMCVSVIHSAVCRTQTI